MVKKKIENLLKKWKTKKYYDYTVRTKDTILAKSYGLPKIYRRNIPLRIVISCIDSPVSQLSDFYKNIMS